MRHKDQLVCDLMSLTELCLFCYSNGSRRKSHSVGETASNLGRGTWNGLDKPCSGSNRQWMKLGCTCFTSVRCPWSVTLVAHEVDSQINFGRSSSPNTSNVRSMICRFPRSFRVTWRSLECMPHIHENRWKIILIVISGKRRFAHKLHFTK